MIRTVIFDIDNTLYSFTDANRAAMDALRAYAREHFGWDEAKFDRLHKAVRDGIFERLGFVSGFRARIIRYQNMLEREGLPLQPHARAMTELYWETLLAHMSPEPDALPVFRSLKEDGLRIGICSDMTAYMQFVKLERLGLLPFVDFMVTSEESGAEKPAAAMFRLCLGKCACRPEECLFVGDDLHKDIEGASLAGMRALWYHPEQESAPDGVTRIASLTEILHRL